MSRRSTIGDFFPFLCLIALAVLAMACGRSTPIVPTESVRSEPPGAAAKGKETFVAQGCGNCHKVAGLPEAKGTEDRLDLSNFGTRFNMRIAENRDFLSNYIRDPQSQRPEATMPKFDKLTNDQLRDLIAYLANLKGSSG